MAKIPGSLWVEGNNLHYVDQFNREWQMPGIFDRAQVAKGGSIWIADVNQYLYFMNEAGTGIYHPNPYGDQIVPIAAKIGSLWIDTDNQIHWAGVPWPTDGNYRYDVRAHNDVATVNTHTDTHADAVHTDTHSDRAHTDVAHVDQHQDYVHTDTHSDIPHSDFSDQGHGDSPSVIFNDHYDAWKQYYWEHLDSGGGPPVYGTHLDAWTPASGVHNDCTHGDTGGNAPCDDHWDGYVHYDTAHTDWHVDSAHQDNPASGSHNDYWDSPPHQDTPHNDIVHLDTHTDVAHTDTHGDAHTDTPHIDHPILIGP